MKELNAAVEKHKQLILDTERYVWKHVETGYKEFKTSAYMAEAFEKLGYELIMAEGITGFYTVLDTGKPGPEILILAELDSIICPEHKDANPETGAVHSCGHNAQCAALVGIAAALKEPGILDKFCGQIMHTYKAGEKIYVTPGNSITIEPFVFHRFYPEKDKGYLIVGEVSKVNDDNCDNVFLNPSERFIPIEEDVPIVHPLVNEYDKLI